MTSLRKIAIAASAVCLAADVVLFSVGFVAPGVIMLGVWSALALAALLIERSHYKAILSAPPGPAWRPCGEQFIDPETGVAVTVYEEPGTGRRAYVATGRT